VWGAQFCIFSLSLEDKIGMHDFLLAKEIVDTVLANVEKNNSSLPAGESKKVSEVVLEIGSISMAHDGFDEHTEDISIDNLEFGLKTITKGTVLEKTNFKVSKTKGEHWKLISIK
jgi:Zn finger protein HypA/HybF involved in hydrogenase expression